MLPVHPEHPGKIQYWLSLWGWAPRIDPLRWGVFGIPTIPTCVYAERDICLTSLPNIVFPVLFGDRMVVAAFFMRSPASWSAHAWSTFLVQYSNLTWIYRPQDPGHLLQVEQQEKANGMEKAARTRSAVAEEFSWVVCCVLQSFAAM